MDFHPPDDYNVASADSEVGAHGFESLTADMVMDALAGNSLYGDGRLPGFA